MNPGDTKNRDLTLSPDTYAYLQNEGKGGLISVYVGPTVINQTGQDRPVRFDAEQRQFIPCSLDTAVQQFPRADEGDYVILSNPAKDKEDAFPSEANQQSRQLSKGRKIVIPGPWSNALWPGQSAQVLKGLCLRSNQYAVVTIYNADEAERNWSKTIVKGQSDGSGEAQAVKAKGLPRPDSFSVGTRIIIQGTDVSFYIPCTGVEVVRDENTGQYVREAVTLEQLEYCCLIDESGKKEYPRGPAVIFPKPTQIFEQDRKKNRKWRPLELNKINGIHCKVTANFEDEDLEQPVGADGKRPKRKYQEGEELFITGKTLQIYYPREELSIIEYGTGNKKHYSTAIPPGEGRYVINRELGEIRVVRGPAMLLPDPRTEILCRRILPDDDCELMYPGKNLQAILDYNHELAAAMSSQPSGRSGLVSEGDFQRSQRKMAAAATRGLAASNMVSYGGDQIEALMDMADWTPEDVGTEGASGGSITRNTMYTKPRELTLNTKFNGVPKVEVWPGSAVLVCGTKDDSRRVVVGPQTILLEYDEKLGHMELSTGKPKSTDTLLKTAYLTVENNQVGDIISIESKDHVTGKIKLSLRVNFEADTEADRIKWFSVSNYVKLLCDHVRSIVAGLAKRTPIATLKEGYIDLVREAILGTKVDGKKRPGLSFENGMRVFEVEVLEFKLDNGGIAQLLDQAQLDVVKTSIELDRQRAKLVADKESETIKQQTLDLLHQTKVKDLELKLQQAALELKFQMQQLTSDLDLAKQKFVNIQQGETSADFVSAARLGRDRSTELQRLEIEQGEQNIALEKIKAETEAAVARFQAAKDGLCEVLVSLEREDIAAKLAQAFSIERVITGDSLGASMGNILANFPILANFFDKASAQSNGGRNRLTQPAGKQ